MSIIIININPSGKGIWNLSSKFSATHNITALQHYNIRVLTIRLEYGYFSHVSFTNDKTWTSIGECNIEGPIHINLVNHICDHRERFKESSYGADCCGDGHVVFGCYMATEMIIRTYKCTLAGRQYNTKYNVSHIFGYKKNIKLLSMNIPITRRRYNSISCPFTTRLSYKLRSLCPGRSQNRSYVPNSATVMVLRCLGMTVPLSVTNHTSVFARTWGDSIGLTCDITQSHQNSWNYCLLPPCNCNIVRSCEVEHFFWH